MSAEMLGADAAQLSCNAAGQAHGADVAMKVGTMGKTLAEKVWDAHVVRSAAGEPDLLYIDMHLVHEVTSPQAFDGLRLANRTVHRPDLTLATEDHNTPTDYTLPLAGVESIKDEVS